MSIPASSQRWSWTERWRRSIGNTASNRSLAMRLLALALLLLPALLTRPAAAEGVEDFYRGKSISMLVASGVGGGYDVYARGFARNVTKHLPGNPVIIVKNM